MWTMKNGLFLLAKKQYHCFTKVFKECLKAEKNEVLIVTDTGYDGKQLAPLTAECYKIAAKELGLKPKVVTEKPKLKGELAEDNIVKQLDKLPNNNIIVLMMSSKVGSLEGLGKSFRKFIKEREHRFVSTSNISNLITDQYKLLFDPIDIDYAELQDRCNKVKEILDNGNEIHVTTKAGTDLHYNIKGKKAISSSGRFCFDGCGGNMPCGEVYTVPKGKKGVYGKVVVDGTITTSRGSSLVKDPLILDIEDDIVTAINDHEEADYLLEALNWAEQKAKYPWGIRRIGEFGIGLNRKAKIVGSTVIDEKSYGSAHVAIGSNYWFGGTIHAIIHLDQIFKDPVIKIDGEILKT